MQQCEREKIPDPRVSQNDHMLFAACFLWCMTQSRIELLLQNVLVDLRECMSWRLSDAALLRPRVWSGPKHAASVVLASHHGNASGQMLCVNVSALTDLWLLAPHCRSLHGGTLVALCLQNLKDWPTM